MTKYKVYKRKIVSPDGKSVAEATSRVATSDNDRANVEQNVSVRVGKSSSSSSISSSSSSSSSSQ